MPLEIDTKEPAMLSNYDFAQLQSSNGARESSGVSAVMQESRYAHAVLAGGAKRGRTTR